MYNYVLCLSITLHPVHNVDQATGLSTGSGVGLFFGGLLLTLVILLISAAILFVIVIHRKKLFIFAKKNTEPDEYVPVDYKPNAKKEYVRERSHYDDDYEPLPMYGLQANTSNDDSVQSADSAPKNTAYTPLNMDTLNDNSYAQLKTNPTNSKNEDPEYEFPQVAMGSCTASQSATKQSSVKYDVPETIEISSKPAPKKKPKKKVAKKYTKDPSLPDLSLQYQTTPDEVQTAPVNRSEHHTEPLHKKVAESTGATNVDKVAPPDTKKK